MRLLIITQKVDIDDGVLGFFHGWLIEFAKHAEKIIVVCLSEGKHDLPNNIVVLSLGKESGKSKIKYLWRFYKYIWEKRNEYKNVFVHMNQEYVLFGGVFWKLIGKNIFMWRNHAKGSWLTNLAVSLSSKVFYTSPHSYTARFKKALQMPVGIDTNFFKPDFSIHKKQNSILFLGRIDPVKNVDIFIEALRELKESGVEFFATIAGSTSLKDMGYEKTVHDKVREYGLDDKVTFTGAVTQSEALTLYRKHKLYINLTLPGSMDKTIFEALASGLKVLVSNTFFKGTLPENWILTNHNDLEGLVLAIRNILTDSYSFNPEFQEKISALLEKHSLDNLMKKLTVATN